MADDISIKIVDAILADLMDRRGFRQEWDQCDDEIKIEIRDAWVRIVKEKIEK